MFERFTERARETVRLAKDEAQALKHPYIGSEHQLLGLFRAHDTIAERALRATGLSYDAVRAAIVEREGQGLAEVADMLPFTPRAKVVYEHALREALSLGHNYIGTEHILLALVRENEGLAAELLLDLKADPEQIRNEVMRLLTGPRAAGTQRERWAEYVICRKRGHVAASESQDRKRCAHCGTTYWTETVQRELGAPVEPADASAA